jgi:hypothetical protein
MKKQDIKPGRIIPIVLYYEEPGYFDSTMKCLTASGLNRDTIIVTREGVGSMSKAFNEGVLKAGGEFSSSDYLLWITNVSFDPKLPFQMLSQMQADNKIAAIHATHKSDHIHLQSKAYKEIPFIELTMAMFSGVALNDVGGMDEQMPYWGMDLDWSYRARQKQYKLAVSGTPEVTHTYLRHSTRNNPRMVHPISILRERLRALRDAQTLQALTKKYGTNWKQKLWPV